MIELNKNSVRKDIYTRCQKRDDWKKELFCYLIHCDPFRKTNHESKELHAIFISRIDEVQLSQQPPQHRLSSREPRKRGEIETV